MSALLGGVVTFSIANSGTTSNAVDLREMILVGLQIGALTGTSFTYLASSDNVTFVALIDKSGATVTHTVAANSYVVIPPNDLAGVRYLKIVASAQAAARTIIGIIRTVQ